MDETGTVGRPGETYERLVSTPGELREQFPLSAAAVSTIEQSRTEVRDILHGRDSRLLVIMGLCSLDNSVQPSGQLSAVVYAHQLRDFSRTPEVAEHVKVVLRVPVSKPRTNIGPAGLSQDKPEEAYAIITTLANDNIPLAIEIMSRDDADYYEDRLSLGWVGARNVEDTLVRHVASDLPIPMLFKNSTTGSLVTAENAILTAGVSHQVKRMRADGRLVLRESLGNPDTGIIFRGGNITSPEQFAQQFIRLGNVKHPIIVDCSHGNSEAFGEGRKTPEAQLACIKAVRGLMQSGHLRTTGLMIESYLRAGADTSGNTPGMSRTDPCIDIDRSLEELTRLAKLQADLRTRRSSRLGAHTRSLPM